MAFNNHLTLFAGKPVVDWEPDNPTLNPDTVYRLAVEFESSLYPSWTDLFAVFLNTPGASEIRELIIGAWNFEEDREETNRVIEALVAASGQLPQLTSLFMGDITYEENEISWIRQSDVSPILVAYPRLEHFQVRGGNSLVLGTLSHTHLKTLIVEAGALDVSVVRDVLRSDLPALEHLELWLGDENYGANTTVTDLAPLFTDQLFPNLRYLGLRDSQIANDIAQAIVTSPLLARIKVLDLSLGVLGDRGATALLNSPEVRKLEKLDIHHHYCSDEIVVQLQNLGITVDTSDQEETDSDDSNDEEYRYVAVGE